MMEVPEKLVEMMASGRPLNQITSLSLSGQFKSLTTLGGSLAPCRSLTSLDLGHNKLGQPGVLALGDALVANGAVRHLELGGNARADADALRAIGTLVAHNRREGTRDGERGVSAALIEPNAAASELVRAGCCCENRAMSTSGSSGPQGHSLAHVAAAPAASCAMPARFSIARPAWIS